MKIRDVNIVRQLENFNVKIEHCGYDLHSYLLSENKPIINQSLFVVYDGQGSYILNGNSYPIKNGSVCYIPRGVPYATCSEQDKPFKLYYLSFSSPDAQAILKHLGFSKNSPVIQTESDYVKNKFSQIYDLLEYDSFNNILKANMLLLDVFYYFSKQKEENDKINTYKHVFVKQAEEIIQQNYSSDITVSAVARHLHLNRSYLSNLFVAVKGITIKQFITVCRINKSIELLKKGDLTITRIAQEVGFNDSVSFYRQFKKINGVSPKQYQQAVKTPPPEKMKNLNGKLEVSLFIPIFKHLFRRRIAI